ncbi:unnamed protein product, partial [Musa textilis]
KRTKISFHSASDSLLHRLAAKWSKAAIPGLAYCLKNLL